jgi:DNA-binding NarL/FixJ family response regulator
MRFTTDITEAPPPRDDRTVPAATPGTAATNPDAHHRPIRVLCVDDHPLIRKGIASILHFEPDMQLVGEAENGRAAVRLFRQLTPDVTLMDLRMPELDGIAATQLIRRDFPEARIIALTSYDGDQDIYRALDAGVRGYLLKETVHADVLHAIRTVQSGKRLMPSDVAGRLSEHFPRIALTRRETEVLECVASGLGNREIADRLGTASGTIKAHVQNILEKLNAADRTQAVTIALQRGIIHLS